MVETAHTVDRNPENSDDSFDEDSTSNSNAQQTGNDRHALKEPGIERTKDSIDVHLQKRNSEHPINGLFDDNLINNSDSQQAEDSFNELVQTEDTVDQQNTTSNLHDGDSINNGSTQQTENSHNELVSVAVVQQTTEIDRNLQSAINNFLNGDSNNNNSTQQTENARNDPKEPEDLIDQDIVEVTALFNCDKAPRPICFKEEDKLSALIPFDLQVSY